MPKPLILHVDDSDLVVQVVRTSLDSEGYRVSTATNLDEVNAQLQSEGMPELIVLDVNMPEAQGDDLVRFFRDQWKLDVPIVLFSDLPRDEIERRATQTGATSFVKKEDGVASLIEVIKEYVLPPWTGDFSEMEVDPHDSTDVAAYSSDEELVPLDPKAAAQMIDSITKARSKADLEEEHGLDAGEPEEPTISPAELAVSPAEYMGGDEDEAPAEEVAAVADLADASDTTDGTGLFDSPDELFGDSLPDADGTQSYDGPPADSADATDDGEADDTGWEDGLGDEATQVQLETAPAALPEDPVAEDPVADAPESADADLGEEPVLAPLDLDAGDDLGEAPDESALPDELPFDLGESDFTPDDDSFAVFATGIDAAEVAANSMPDTDQSATGDAFGSDVPADSDDALDFPSLEEALAADEAGEPIPGVDEEDYLAQSRSSEDAGARNAMAALEGDDASALSPDAVQRELEDGDEETLDTLGFQQRMADRQLPSDDGVAIPVGETDEPSDIAAADVSDEQDPFADDAFDDDMSDPGGSESAEALPMPDFGEAAAPAKDPTASTDDRHRSRRLTPGDQALAPFAAGEDAGSPFDREPVLVPIEDDPSDVDSLGDDSPDLPPDRPMTVSPTFGPTVSPSEIDPLHDSQLEQKPESADATSPEVAPFGSPAMKEQRASGQPSDTPPRRMRPRSDNSTSTTTHLPPPIDTPAIGGAKPAGASAGAGSDTDRFRRRRGHVVGEHAAPTSPAAMPTGPGVPDLSPLDDDAPFPPTPPERKPAGRVVFRSPGSTPAPPSEPPKPAPAPAPAPMAKSDRPAPRISSRQPIESVSSDASFAPTTPPVSSPRKPASPPRDALPVSSGRHASRGSAGGESANGSPVWARFQSSLTSAIKRVERALDRLQKADIEGKGRQWGQAAEAIERDLRLMRREARQRATPSLADLLDLFETRWTAFAEAGIDGAREGAETRELRLGGASGALAMANLDGLLLDLLDLLRDCTAEGATEPPEDAVRNLRARLD